MEITLPLPCVSSEGEVVVVDVKGTPPFHNLSEGGVVVVCQWQEQSLHLMC